MAIDYIGFYNQHVESLKKRGKQYFGWCPFHPDRGTKRKGFTINPENGLWYCFSCGAGGNTFQFCRERGIDPKDSPDYHSEYRQYSFAGGVISHQPHFQDIAGKPFWSGPKEARDKTVYNSLAIELAKKQKRTLWICEGPKDAETLHEAGELAIALPSAESDNILERVSFVDVPEVIVAMDHNMASRDAARRISQRFPFAKVIEWPNETADSYDVSDQWYDLLSQETEAKEEAKKRFVQMLKGYAVSKDPYYPLTEFLQYKREKDQTRDSGELLGYNLQKFKTLANNIDGIQSGFYVIGSETNGGKTAYLCNLTLDLLESNEDLSGIYFSLGDNKDTVLNRFLSIVTALPLNQVQRLQKTKWHTAVLQKSYRHLSKMAKEERFYLRDASEIQDIDSLIREIRRRMNRELFIVIDDLYNLEVGSAGADHRERTIEHANRLKNFADIYRIPIICSAELHKKENKASADRVPAIEDLMEAGRFASNANLVLLLYSDKLKYYNNDDEPLLNLKYSKNKLSHYRGTDKIKFIKRTSQIQEFQDM